MAHLLSLAVADDDRHAIARAVHPSDLVTHCDNAIDLLTLIARGASGPVIIAVPQPPSSADFRLQNGLAILQLRPTIVRVDFTKQSHQIPLIVTHAQADTYLSIRGFEDISNRIRNLLETGDAESTPNLHVVQRIVHHLPFAITNVVLSALIAGPSRMHADLLAQVCGLRPRTLEWKLAEAQRPGPRDILRWSIALHTTWCLERLHWPLKKVSRAVGFENAAALTAVIKRVTGRTPTHIVRHGGFENLAAEFAKTVISANI
jgi:AraC-like DNA-binding protein